MDPFKPRKNKLEKLELNTKRNLLVYFGNIVRPDGVAYTVTEILDNFNGPLFTKRLFSTSVVPEFARSYHAPVFHHTVWRAMCKTKVPNSLQHHAALRIASRHIKPKDVVYIWPPYSTPLIRLAKARGATVVAERINCMAGMSKEVIGRAFVSAGQTLPQDFFLPEDVAEEEMQMKLCDFVTAPNPYVVMSLLSSGVQPQKILETSYGWSPLRLDVAVNINRPKRPPVFLFVGSGIVRKGLDLLLNAWVMSGSNGILHIAGQIDNEVRKRCKDELARPDVKELGFKTDMASVYANADIFVFPSHEEGGPQVTYEAAGCGLPCIVSPMGAGRIVRNGVEGFVVDPYDICAWADSIRRLTDDEALRRQMGASAASRAQTFTWAKVGSRLYELFTTRV